MNDRTPDDHVALGGDELAFRVTSADSGGALVAVEVRMPAGGGPPMLHRHASAEIYRVEAGEFAFYVAGDDGELERTVAGPGACVAIPGGREHTIRNESSGEARAFVVFAPGAEMERVFRAGGELTARGTPSPADIVALAAAHGIEITRPLPEAA